jgi:hypothetical protein
MTTTFDAAPFSPLVRIVSLLASALLILMPAFSLLGTGSPVGVGIVVLILCWSILGITWAMAPHAYELSPDGLTIRRRVGRRQIPLADISSAEADESAMKGAMRLMASGGLFGFFGTFRNKRLGTFHAFVTDPAQSVVIRSSGKPVVLSPEEPTAFLRRLQDLRDAAATTSRTRAR